MLNRISLLVKRKAFTSLIGLSAQRVIGYLFPLLLIPYLLSRLGQSGFGQYSYTQSIIQYFAGVIAYGFLLTGINDIVKVKESEKDELEFVFFKIVYTKITLFIISGILLFLASFFLYDKFSLSNYINILLYLLGNVFFLDWFYIGKQKIVPFLIANIFIQAINYGICLVIVKNSTHTDYAIFTFCFSYFIINFVLFIYTILSNSLSFYSRKVNFSVITNELRTGFIVFISLFLVHFYTTVNKIVFGKLYGPTLLAEYTFPETFFLGIAAFSSAFNLAIFPHLIKAHKEGNIYFRNIVKKYAVISLSVYAFIFLLFFIFATPILNLLAPSMVSANIITIFKIQLIALLVFPLGGFFSQIFIIKDKKKLIFYSTLFTSIFSLICFIALNFILVNKSIALTINITANYFFIIFINWFFYRSL